MSANKRECNKCGESKSSHYYIQSQWNKIAGHAVQCTECTLKDKRKSTSYKAKKGHIYIISNPTWKEWYKVGLTTQTPETRLANFNIGAPQRDYILHLAVVVDDVSKAEYEIHKLIKSTGVLFNNEWFKADLGKIKAILQSY